jgi:hypothetical protein
VKRDSKEWYKRHSLRTGSSIVSSTKKWTTYLKIQKDLAHGIGRFVPITMAIVNTRLKQQRKFLNVAKPFKSLLTFNSFQPPFYKICIRRFLCPTHFGKHQENRLHPLYVKSFLPIRPRNLYVISESLYNLYCNRCQNAVKGIQ